MFIDFINRILGAEKVSVSNRQEKVTTPDVIEKSSTNTKPIPEKYKKDITALERYYDCELSSLTGLCITLTLQEALSIMSRERRRIDAYKGLQSYLKRELGITLSITSQKTKPKSL